MKQEDTTTEDNAPTGALPQRKFHEGGRREMRRQKPQVEIVSAYKARRILESLHVPLEGAKMFMRYRDTFWIDEHGSRRRVFPKTRNPDKVVADRSALYVQTSPKTKENNHA